ncbi:MAG: 16S rRNA (cytidine(1402)-2'-O)-methyltransferase [Lachnospirales bacterium]
MLYICGTPLGNLKDISFRVLEILEECDYIACEDTRNTLKLTNYYSIETKGKLISYHEHNKGAKGIELINLLKTGKNIALVSDAGMPIISDPGNELVNLCIEEDLEYTTVPTATAFVSALILSGVSTRNFIFDGFLPTSTKEKKELINGYVNEFRTVAIYVAPHHLKKTLNDLKIINRKMHVIREITKIYEEKISGSAEDLLTYFEKKQPRGEMVLIIEGKNKSDILQEKINYWLDKSIEDHVNIYVEEGFTKKEAMKKVAKDRGTSKSDIYNSLLSHN